MIIDSRDNVEVRDDGHKYAIKPIAEGESVIKYGMPIGHATKAIAVGEHVHTHNVATNLGSTLTYEYRKVDIPTVPITDVPKVTGYRRKNGSFGIRNDIWIVPTVACVNQVCETLAEKCGGIALTHPYGCSQLGRDHEMTAEILAGLCRNPNAGGVLVVGLGCENNTLESFQKRVGDGINIRYLRAQDSGDEIERGLELIGELEVDRVSERTEASVSELVVGMKCGGSDGFSGLTANPLIGRFTDWLTACGGSAILTEVPEMFGAETLLMNRCKNRDVFDRCVKMINGFKEYYVRYNQVCYENPSPGNKAGGITTLEDKSLGCVQKGGHCEVTDVLDYGERVRCKGLSLMTGPGNDPVACTVLAAAGCQLILFSTGRGTPFGSVVPTLKIASNSTLATAKPNWIDWDAMAKSDTKAFAEMIIDVANGKLAANERNRARHIAIFKDGVTL